MARDGKTVGRIKKLLVMLTLCLLAGCSTTTRVASGIPMTTAPRLPSDLSGRYLNVGWEHTPDAKYPIKAYLDVMLGAASYPDTHDGTIFLCADNEKIVLARVDGDHILQQITLTRNRDYRVTTEGIERTRFSEGPGPEGVFYVKISTRILIRIREDGSLVLNAHDDIHGMSLWPYRDSRDRWLEFKKEATR